MTTQPTARPRLPFRMPERSSVANASLELAGTIPLPPYGPNKKRADMVGALYERVANAPPPPAYGLRYDRWNTTLDNLTTANPGCVAFTCAVRERMIVGLGDESARETSITLQRLDGVPMIPGSAIKGLIRRVAAFKGFTVLDPETNERRELRDSEREILSGSTKDASYITYLDAWYVPGSAKLNHPLRRDVMTPHHTKYNTSRGQTAPTDFEDPIPVAFLSAIGQYRFALIGPDPEWTALAKAALLYGLEHWGIGAKTSSGYGRLIEVT